MDKDDLKWVKIKEDCPVLANQLHGMLLLKPLVVGKLSVFSGMVSDALLHREGLKG